MARWALLVSALCVLSAGCSVESSELPDVASSLEETTTVSAFTSTIAETSTSVLTTSTTIAPFDPGSLAVGWRFEQLDIDVASPVEVAPPVLHEVTASPVGMVLLGELGGVAPEENRSLMWFSADGSSWQQVESESLQRAELFDVTTGGLSYVAVGNDCSAPDADPCLADPAVWTSRDGLSWNRAPHDSTVFPGCSGQGGNRVNPYLEGMLEDCSGGGRPAMLYRVSGTSRGLIAVGMDPTWTMLWHSSDGVVWSRADAEARPEYPTQEDAGWWIDYQEVPGAWTSLGLLQPGLRCIDRFDGDQYLGQDCFGFIWWSVDGTAWTPENQDDDLFTEWSPVAVFDVDEGAVVLGNRSPTCTWCLLGSDVEDTDPEGFGSSTFVPLYSTDGTTWAEANAVSADLGQVKSAVSTPVGMIAFGEAHVDEGLVMWHSADGISWTPVPEIANAAGDLAVHGVAWSGGELLVLGSVIDEEDTSRYLLGRWLDALPLWPPPRDAPVRPFVPPFDQNLGLSPHHDQSEEIPVPEAIPGPIVHDAEYYVLFDQHGDRWQVEDGELDIKLAELEEQFGAKPNIVHIMWDDMAFGDAGIPALNKVRGFDTPNSNRMAAEGALFTRYYTEAACTPSRAAVLTGRYAVRSGMYNVAFPIEASGLAGEEVTMADVLSDAGYATAFYGKWHLGDIEESYPTKQGFDETLFTPYNQVLSLWNQVGEGANAVQGVVKEMLQDDPYAVDKTFGPSDWIMSMEGTKDGEMLEWKSSSLQDYNEIDPECESRGLEFIRRNADSKTPFYLAYWPLMTAFIPNPMKTTVSRGLLGEGFTNVDAYLGAVMDQLIELGIAENTILVAHGDNGPMVHDPPPGLGMAETVFRGGKSDYWEGGIRVAALAWWPGMIEAGSIIGDMIHEVDLYTTFARLAGATDAIPTDRIIDGIDQTALLVNGDTYGRRDYNFVYTGNILAATIKGRYKRVWVGDHPGLPGAAFYDLYNDPREVNPALVPFLGTSSSFTTMRKRHEIWKQKYPDRPTKHGVAFTGIANAREETKRLADPPVDLDKLPFDPLEYIDFELPWDGLDAD